MRKFSRKQLLRAYAQMQEEGRREASLAEQAAKWLTDQSGLSVHATRPSRYVSDGNRSDIPYLPEFLLAIIVEKYAAVGEQLRSQLTSPPEREGINRDEAGFWLELGKSDGFPDGTRYYCYTETVDAQESGF